MRSLIIPLSLIALATPAQADSSRSDGQFLDLFPNGRAAYQDKYEQNAEKYQAQGYDFIERLYGDRGEGASLMTNRQPPMPEAEVDSYINSIPTAPSTKSE